MKFKISAVVPDLALDILNEHEVIREVTEMLRTRLLRRTVNGQAAEGSLPQPKDGTGSPYNRTGTLLGSIEAAVHPKTEATDGGLGRGGGWYGIVTPTGERPKYENAEGKLKEAKIRARLLRRDLRAAEAIGTALQRLVGRAAKPRNVIIRARATETNAALAAILSQPPKDVRARNGGRGVYRVFEVRDSEADEAAAVTRNRMRAAFRETGQKKIE